MYMIIVSSVVTNLKYCSRVSDQLFDDIVCVEFLSYLELRSVAL